MSRVSQASVRPESLLNSFEQADALMGDWLFPSGAAGVDGVTDWVLISI
jgi:hypothetical protein